MSQCAQMFNRKSSSMNFGHVTGINLWFLHFVQQSRDGKDLNPFTHVLCSWKKSDRSTSRIYYWKRRKSKIQKVHKRGTKKNVLCLKIEMKIQMEARKICFLLSNWRLILSMLLLMVLKSHPMNLYPEIGGNSNRKTFELRLQQAT